MDIKQHAKLAQVLQDHGLKVTASAWRFLNF